MYKQKLLAHRASNILKIDSAMFSTRQWWYNYQGIIHNFKMFLFRSRRLSQICPVWVFPIILNHKYQEIKNKHYTMNVWLHQSFFQSDSFLSLPVIERWICSGWGSLPFEKCWESIKRNQTIFSIFRAIPASWSLLFIRGSLDANHVKCTWTIWSRTSCHATVT